ncbi:hypothetical protein BOTBODRAFT_144155 [Botryobasidium botryosum FD-172 SS1]|uniref:Uncharacterized protein n=1 Tax=Botryobasidium botryosum (strain FD-172 SS1) TaxID=930990 RepID=A0A067MNB4_BOTB1|nr:hypothetical protein BOTBODRAFT_144155 [Botryobasidium botryosum FD-172 SS1]
MAGILVLHATVMSKMDVVPEHSSPAPSENEALLPWGDTASDTPAMKYTTADKLEVIRTNMPYNVALGYVYIISIAVWPAITISIRSVNWGPSGSGPLFFSPPLFTSFHFLVISTSVWLSTLLCTYPQLMIWAPRKILTISLARTAFVPLFLLCNLQRPGQGQAPSASPPFINSDAIYFLILVAFGMSEGYTATLSMMAAPSTEHNLRLRKDQGDTAATIADHALRRISACARNRSRAEKVCSQR